MAVYRQHIANVRNFLSARRSCFEFLPPDIREEKYLLFNLNKIIVLFPRKNVVSGDKNAAILGTVLTRRYLESVLYLL